MYTRFIDIIRYTDKTPTNRFVLPKGLCKLKALSVPRLHPDDVVGNILSAA